MFGTYKVLINEQVNEESNTYKFSEEFVHEIGYKFSIFKHLFLCWSTTHIQKKVKGIMYAAHEWSKSECSYLNIT